MKVNVLKEINGKMVSVIEERPDEEKKDDRSIGEKITAGIRERYSLDDEISILRQRETKPVEFAEYFSFVESIKAKVKGESTK